MYTLSFAHIWALQVYFGLLRVSLSFSRVVGKNMSEIRPGSIRELSGACSGKVRVLFGTVLGNLRKYQGYVREVSGNSPGNVRDETRLIM